MVQTLLDWYASVGYWALFFGVMLENAGLPVPGETALLLAGYLASPHGGSQLGLGPVVLVAFAAAVLGDNLGYWLGRVVARRRLERGQRFLLLTPARFRRVDEYFHRYGAATVFVGRFVALLRIAAGPAAGAAGMPWPRFLAANAAGAAVWATTIALLGYYFGQSWELLERWLGRGAWAAAGVAVLAAAGWRLRRWVRERRAEGPEPAGGLPQVNDLSPRPGGREPVSDITSEPADPA